VLVAFVAYTVYKELERRLHEAGIAMSPNRVMGQLLVGKH
jgi:hypothetical protein